MKNSEIIQMTEKELFERIDEEKAVLLKMRLNHTVSPLDNPMQISESKRTIARLMTEKRKRELTNAKNS